MFFDTHAHYDDHAFDDDRNELICSLSASSVAFVINPGCDIESSLKARELSHNYDFMYFAAGIHPEELKNLQDNALEVIEDIAKDNKCVAIGEIGLDYYWDSSNKEEQKNIFKAQMNLAEKLCKPVIIHDREAHGDSFEIINEYTNVRGVFHCYSGSAEMAVDLLKRGYYLGFDGPVTYKNNKKSVEVLKLCPLNRILIETDSPYLSPVPRRGKRNDSRNLIYVAEKIAEIKNLSVEEIEDITLNNAREFFAL